MRRLLIGGLMMLASVAASCAPHQEATQAGASPSAGSAADTSSPSPAPAPVAATQVVTVTPAPTSPSPMPSVSAVLPGVPSASPSLPPVAVGLIAAKATPAPAPSPAATDEPIATPTPEMVAKMLPANAKPEIIGVQLSATTLHGGDTVSGVVETSSNVASVEARIATYSISVPKVGIGRFALNYVVPNLPFFLRKSYDLVVIARNTRGDEIVRTIPIKIQ